MERIFSRRPLRFRYCRTLKNRILKSGLLLLLMMGLGACGEFESKDLASEPKVLVANEMFIKFKKAIDKNCNACHTSVNSLTPGVSDFASLKTEDDWANHPLKLVVAGDLRKSLVYYRMRFAKTITGSASSNMPFETAEAPDNMTQQDADDIANYIMSLGSTTVTEQAADLGTLAKIKMVLNGKAISTLDVASTLKDGSSILIDEEKLKARVQIWLQEPEGQEKLKNFFMLALGQNQLEGFSNNLLGFVQANNNREVRFRENMSESFARTALKIVNEDQPFTNIVSSRNHAMTSALLSGYRYVDASGAQSVPMNSRAFRDHLRALPVGDFTDWRFVNLTNRNNDNPTAFDDMAALRAVADNDDFSLQIRRVGFFSTLAFQVKWMTNVDNDFRVTANQALIGALNKTFEAGDATAHGEDLSALDSDHAAPGTACYQCHRLLDPMRAVFRQSMNENYRVPASGVSNVPNAYFAFQDYRQDMQNVGQLATNIKNHPYFADSWVGKLCQFVNSQPCDDKDDEFNRIADVFRNSNFNFMTMAVELLTSPLVTRERGLDNAMISISRRSHFCRALEVRFAEHIERTGSASIAPRELCDLNNDVRSAVALISDDDVARGAPGFVQSPDTSPFNYQSVERLCKLIAPTVVRADHGFGFGNTEALTNSLDAMVNTFMGLPSNHPRHEAAERVLKAIYDKANSTEVGLDEINSLRESFIFACSSPDLAGMGL